MSALKARRNAVRPAVERYEAFFIASVIRA